MSLSRLINEREATVCVLGLGYVGLPLALLIARKGFEVRGYDPVVNSQEKLERKLSSLHYLHEEESGEAAASISVSGDESLLDGCDIYIVCVPTPLTERDEPDLSYVVEAADTIERHVSSGALVVLESTTYPGTTREVFRPRLEANGKIAGSDFLLAYSPEREDPGNRSFRTSDIPKVVGADDEASREAAFRFYSALVKEVVLVSSSAAAEGTKLLENIYRAVNISLVNELKVAYEALGVDIWEVISAAATKPFGFQAFYPGPGIGGHCIPVDPFYLAHRAREAGIPARFIELAGNVNRSMPEYVLTRLEHALARREKKLSGSRVLVLGVAYKPDISDTRNSPALVLIRMLAQRGCDVRYYDPFVPSLAGHGGVFEAMRSLSPSDISVDKCDAAVMVTNHSAFDIRKLKSALRLIIDTRNVFGSSDPSCEVVKA
ncbi:MAG: nucleotide sugar dehydrogenase [Planctomycetota bacterium]|nr:nucleotide sugar dehydrogenase [Planctomycetota bacterium]